MFSYRSPKRSKGIRIFICTEKHQKMEDERLPAINLKKHFNVLARNRQADRKLEMEINSLERNLRRTNYQRRFIGLTRELYLDNVRLYRTANRMLRSKQSRKTSSTSNSNEITQREPLPSLSRQKCEDSELNKPEDSSFTYFTYPSKTSLDLRGIDILRTPSRGTNDKSISYNDGSLSPPKNLPLMPDRLQTQANSQRGSSEMLIMKDADIGHSTEKLLIRSNHQLNKGKRFHHTSESGNSRNIQKSPRILVEEARSISITTSTPVNPITADSHDYRPTNLNHVLSSRRRSSENIKAIENMINLRAGRTNNLHLEMNNVNLDSLNTDVINMNLKSDMSDFEGKQL